MTMGVGQGRPTLVADMAAHDMREKLPAVSQ